MVCLTRLVMVIFTKLRTGSHLQSFLLCIRNHFWRNGCLKVLNMLRKTWSQYTLHILSHNLQVKSQFNSRFSKKQVYALQNSYFYLSTFILSSCQMALHKKVTFKMGNHDEGHSSTNIHKHWNIKIQRAILEPLSKH